MSLPPASAGAGSYTLRTLEPSSDARLAFAAGLVASIFTALSPCSKSAFVQDDTIACALMAVPGDDGRTANQVKSSAVQQQ